jgi:hypothetical protein
MKCGGQLPKGKNCFESGYITFGNIFSQTRLVYLGNSILRLTKNGTDVRETETTSVTDNNSILRKETKSVSETLVYLNYIRGCRPERIL